jgi:DNA-binding FadR family transcriptional regulator
MRSITRTNLADTAVEAIRTEILERRWALGERLPNEAALSAMLSVSRGTVREAVRVLVSQGYLETRQGSGTYVLSTVDAARPLTMARRASLRDQFEARVALDAEAARLAALRQTPAVIAGLRPRRTRCWPACTIFSPR